MESDDLPNIDALCAEAIASADREARRTRLILEWGAAVIATIIAYTIAGDWRGADAAGHWAWLVASLGGLYCFCALTWLILLDIAKGRAAEWGDGGLTKGCAGCLVLPFLIWAYCGLGYLIVLRAYDAVRALTG